MREYVHQEQSLKQTFEAVYTVMSPRYGSLPILEHCIPFDVSRVYDELGGTRPRIWTHSTDLTMWQALQD